MKRAQRNKLSCSLVLLTFLLLVQPVAFAQSFLMSASTTERDALISLYNTTGGDSWGANSGWKDSPTSADGFNEDPCVEPVWHGVTCTGDSVTQLNLSYNQLTGEIPVELANLSNLEDL